ncbi:DUF485 domain-containing protein [Cryptosporangium phraense]|uniref:DUF485 domain-containing protein n=1 Tax=Cryptosporangium phraense TaxID=2593070 RepID=A0A545AJA4_9ACTN|nr:DUF485 domain-containing protein [Cryptosporangium phraense]TQS41416.1 DUF485 domain-containing protein [Cryptosporangium phraense]
MSTDVQPTDAEVPDERGRRAIAMQASDEFAQLRHTIRRFIFPMTAAFLVWYLLYVVLSAYARDFMGTKVVGNINIAFVFGILQFVSTFLIAWLYSRYAAQRFDPQAESIKAELDAEAGTAAVDPADAPPATPTPAATAPAEADVTKDEGAAK